MFREPHPAPRPRIGYRASLHRRGPYTRPLANRVVSLVQSRNGFSRKGLGEAGRYDPSVLPPEGQGKHRGVPASIMTSRGAFPAPKVRDRRNFLQVAVSKGTEWSLPCRRVVPGRSVGNPPCKWQVILSPCEDRRSNTTDTRSPWKRQSFAEYSKHFGTAISA